LSSDTRSVLCGPGMGLGRRILYRAALDEKSHWSVRLVTKKISEAPQISLGVAFGDAAGDALRTSPTGPRKRTLSDRLRPRGPKMRLGPGPAARRILFGLSAATKTWPKYASRMRLYGRAECSLASGSSSPPDSDPGSMRLLTCANTGAEASLWQSAATLMAMSRVAHGRRLPFRTN
jgi:hypothetical protein